MDDGVLQREEEEEEEQNDGFNPDDYVSYRPRKPEEEENLEKETIEVEKKEVEVAEEKEDECVPVEVGPMVKEERIQEQKYGLDDFLHGFDNLGIIGSGGVSDIHLLEQKNTGSKFAYKGINDERLKEATKFNSEAPAFFANLLRREANLMARMGRLDNKHFPAFVIDRTCDVRPGLLVPYYEEGSLDKRIGKLDTKKAINYVRQIAGSIKLLHEQKDVVCLGDIKPSNFLKNGEHIVLGDLNLFYSEGEVVQESIVHSMMGSIIDESSKIRGTIRYMAPEQRDGEADVRTDVYQLSFMAYELLTGFKPEGDFEDLDKVNPEVGDLNRVLRKGMARKPENRYASIGEFLEDFNRAIETTQEPEAIKDSDIDLILDLTQEPGDEDPISSDLLDIVTGEKTLKEIKDRNRGSSALEARVKTADVIREDIGIIKEGLKIAGRGIYKGAYYAAYVPAAILALPTILRKVLCKFPKEDPYSKDAREMCFGGITTANLAAYYIPSIGFGYWKEALIASGIGNLIFGSYELIRAGVKRAKKKKENLATKIIGEYGGQEGFADAMVEKICNGEAYANLTKEFGSKNDRIYAGWKFFEKKINPNCLRSKDYFLKKFVKMGFAPDKTCANLIFDKMVEERREIVVLEAFESIFEKVESREGEERYRFSYIP